MSSVYGRLGFSFDTTKFNGADTLSPNVINFLSNTSIDLAQWQIDDLAAGSTTGYYQNPHNDSLGAIAVFLTGMSTYANTEMWDYGTTMDTANGLGPIVTTAQTSLTNFTNHTNNLSGVTKSTDISLYPDLNSALSVGRQILNITTKTDNVQNNTPILGNFTSLYVGSDLLSQANTMANCYITLSGSFISNVSNISNSAMANIITNITTLQTFLNNQVSSDTSFYQNSYAVATEYSTVAQFSHLGATQNSLITLIGTDKLKTDLS